MDGRLEWGFIHTHFRGNEIMTDTFDDLIVQHQQFVEKLYELSEQQLELAFLFAEGYRDFRYHEKGRYWIADKSFGNDSEEIYRLHQILRVCDVDCRHHLTAYQYPYYTDNLIRLMQQRHWRLGWGRNGEFQQSLLFLLGSWIISVC